MPKGVRIAAGVALAIGIFGAVLGCAARPEPPPLPPVGAGAIEALLDTLFGGRAGGAGRDARGAQRGRDSSATAYDQAVDAFVRQVAELDAGLPIERRLTAVHRAIDLLADAIERIPRGEGLALGEAAAEIRHEARDLEGAPLESGLPTAVVKRVLTLANANLRLAAERPYAHTPRVGVTVTQLGYAITTITERRPLAFELDNVVASLREAAVVLRAIQSAAATLDAETPA